MDIQHIPAGRELDERIEFEVMGMRRPAKGFFINPKHYSTDIAAAWEIIKYVRNKWIFSKRERFYDQLHKQIMNPYYPNNIAWPSALSYLEPVHIARAALLALQEG